MTESNKNEAANPEEELLKAKSDALRLLSFSARSAEELRGRLKLKKKYSDALIGRVIEDFQRQGLVNDVKFAKLFAESRVYSRPAGKRQLEMDLKKKGLPAELVRQTVANLRDYDEKSMVRELAKTRLKSMTGISKEKKKTRLYGFLKRRGFGNDSIFPVMDELLKGISAEDTDVREDSSEDG